MNLIRIDTLFNYEKGSLQSSKNASGDYNFITASAEWKTHHEYTHDTEALIFAAAAAGSLGRTHYVNGKFIASDLCFILTPKDPNNYPIDLKFYHIIFNELRYDIVKNTKSGTSKEAIGLSSFGEYEIPYFNVNKQIEARAKYLASKEIKDELSSEQAHQLDHLKKLRQQILQDAIQGKLVPQDPNDEPANKLLERIKAEKEKLVREKKIKKEKPLPEIKPEEIPFEIPKNWAWCRLGEICEQIFDMEHKMPKAVNEGGIMFLSAKDLLDDGTINYSNNVKHISHEDYEYFTKNFTPSKNDIIYSRRGANLGKSRIVERDIKYLVSYSCCTIRTLNPSIEYVNFVMDSGFTLEQAVINTTDHSIPDLGVQKIKDFLIPLPPLQEQNRTIKKVKQIKQVIDELELTIKQNLKSIQDLLQVALKEALEPSEDSVQI